MNKIYINTTETHTLKHTTFRSWWWMRCAALRRTGYTHTAHSLVRKLNDENGVDDEPKSTIIHAMEWHTTRATSFILFHSSTFLFFHLDGASRPSPIRNKNKTKKTPIDAEKGEKRRSSRWVIFASILYPSR